MVNMCPACGKSQATGFPRRGITITERGRQVLAELREATVFSNGKDSVHEPQQRSLGSSAVRPGSDGSLPLQALRETASLAREQQ
jgi:DNA-binding PadR family transcriptional regulator